MRCSLQEQRSQRNSLEGRGPGAGSAVCVCVRVCASNVCAHILSPFVAVDYTDITDTTPHTHTHTCMHAPFSLTVHTQTKTYSSMYTGSSVFAAGE